VEPPKEKRARMVLAAYRDDAVKIAVIQSELWRLAIEAGDTKKPSVADAIHHLIVSYEKK
jgi:hypothetical protein